MTHPPSRVRPPRTIGLGAAASPRPRFHTEYPRGGRGVAATRLRKIRAAKALLCCSRVDEVWFPRIGEKRRAKRREDRKVEKQKAKEKRKADKAQAKEDERLRLRAAREAKRAARERPAEDPEAPVVDAADAAAAPAADVEVPAPAPSPEDPAANWERHVDDGGNEYFFNPDTGETTWSAPGGLAAEDWVQTADGEWVRGGEGGA